METADLGTGIAWYYWVLLTIRDKHNLVNMKTKFTLILISHSSQAENDYFLFWDKENSQQTINANDMMRMREWAGS